MRKNWARLAALTLLLALLPAMALAAEFAVVRGGRLNLREYPSSSSRSLGKYDTGTWIRVDSGAGDGWYAVRTLEGRRGYMQGNYLSFGASAGSATVRYANGGYVNLRSGPSLDYSVVMRVTSGTTITIMDDSYEWNYVRVDVGGGSTYGYMHDSLISREVATATVSTRNGGRVNVRSGPSASYASLGTLSTGTRVSVLLKGNGWYRIAANGIEGYMSTQYLSGGSSGSGSTTTSLVAYVNNPRSTQVLNLRETPSQSARSIGQYRNGTKVKVVKKGSTWCEVYVGTRHGYMMTRYLSFDGNYLPPSYPTTPSYPSEPSYPSYPSYPSVTPTPQVVYITPTPQVVYITPTPAQSVPSSPKAGDTVTLAIASGSGSSMINVYHDSALTQLKGSYTPGTQAMMLQYGTSTCMIYVGGGVAYVSTWNVNY